ncbi:MAG: hydroxymethylglutaryl-CoA lyase [Tissierellales bacterium]|nr:hydroxymethylglutaryl-CoA lyase [Tissierellales bacterium]MBN2827932.1 hydroxymethylglutaryl-CoA lyase [Tissierellales bacterium]
MFFPGKITICEVGPRDGFQNEKGVISLEDKIFCINQATESGYQVIEIGSFVHPKAVPQMSDTDEIAKHIKRKDDVQYRALVTNLRGIERAASCGVNKVKLTVSASESHNMTNFNKKPYETINDFQACVELADKYNMSVSGAISTAFGCPFEGPISLDRIAELVESFMRIGIHEISLSDTTGVANPKQVYERSQILTNRYSNIKWFLHFHNTRGMALANVVAGMSAGITHYDAAFAGLGGCPYAPGASGNLSSEDLVHMLHEMGIETGVNLDQAIKLGAYVKKMVNHDTDSYILVAGKVSDLVKEKPIGQINNNSSS